MIACSASPEELRAATTPLLALLARLFSGDTYHESHFLRGVYFSSGVQKGSPIAAACRQLVGEQALSLEESDVQLLMPQSRPCFVADFYASKIFPEAGLVVETEQAGGRRKRLRSASWVAAAVVALVGVVFSVRDVRAAERGKSLAGLFQVALDHAADERGGLDLEPFIDLAQGLDGLRSAAAGDGSGEIDQTVAARMLDETRPGLTSFAANELYGRLLEAASSWISTPAEDWDSFTDGLELLRAWRVLSVPPEAPGDPQRTSDEVRAAQEIALSVLAERAGCRRGDASQPTQLASLCDDVERLVRELDRGPFLALEARVAGDLERLVEALDAPQVALAPMGDGEGFGDLWNWLRARGLDRGLDRAGARIEEQLSWLNGSSVLRPAFAEGWRDAHAAGADLLRAAKSFEPCQVVALEDARRQARSFFDLIEAAGPEPVEFERRSAGVCQVGRGRQDGGAGPSVRR